MQVFLGFSDWHVGINRTVPSDLTRCRGLGIESASPRHHDSEGSASQQRGLGISAKSKEKFCAIKGKVGFSFGIGVGRPLQLPRGGEKPSGWKSAEGAMEHRRGWKPPTDKGGKKLNRSPKRATHYHGW